MEKKIAYIDGVDWQHEVGYASGGNSIYPSIQDLIEYQPCAKYCGIVEIELTEKSWPHKQDLDSDQGISAHEMDKTEYKHYEVIRTIRMLIRHVNKLSDEDWKSLSFTDDNWKSCLHRLKQLQTVKLSNPNKFADEK